MDNFLVGATVLIVWTLSMTSLSLRTLNVPEEDRLAASLSMGAAFTLLGIPLLQVFH